MGLFNFGKKNPQEEEVQEKKAPGDPTTMLLFRVLAIGYVAWLLKDVIKAYFEGGPEAPSTLLVVVATVVLGAGCIWIGFATYRQWKEMKKARWEYNEEMARQVAEEERLEAERKALEEEFPEGAEYHEEETDSEPEETVSSEE